jgi:hypothetical protein
MNVVFRAGEILLRPLRKLFAKIAGSKKKRGAKGCAPLLFCNANEN